jgi:hypothetical protein
MTPSVGGFPGRTNEEPPSKFRSSVMTFDETGADQQKWRSLPRK